MLRASWTLSFRRSLSSSCATLVSKSTGVPVSLPLHAPIVFPMPAASDNALVGQVHCAFGRNKGSCMTWACATTAYHESRESGMCHVTSLQTLGGKSGRYVRTSWAV